MKTTYEIHPTLATVTTKGEAIALVLEEGVGTVIKVELTHERATSIRRALARVLGISGDDPSGGYSMKDLAETRKTLKNHAALSSGAVIEIIDAYMRLIEYVNEEKI